MDINRPDEHLVTYEERSLVTRLIKIRHPEWPIQTPPKDHNLNAISQQNIVDRIKPADLVVDEEIENLERSVQGDSNVNDA